MPPFRASPYAPKNVELALRRMEVVRMRAAHRPFRDIADALGVSEKTIRNDLRIELERRAAELREEGGLDTVRQMEAAKLDAIERAILPRLEEDKGWDRAAHALVRVIERRANLLGLDTPVVREQLNHLKIDVTLADGSMPPSQPDVVDGEVVDEGPAPPALGAGGSDRPS